MSDELQLYVIQFGKTEHNARLLSFSYKPMFATNIFFGEEAFFAPSYNMITHGSFDTKRFSRAGSIHCWIYGRCGRECHSIYIYLYVPVISSSLSNFAR